MAKGMRKKPDQDRYTGNDEHDRQAGENAGQQTDTQNGDPNRFSLQPGHPFRAQRDRQERSG